MDSPRTKNIAKNIVKVLQFIKVKLQQGRKLVEESDTTISYSEFTMLFEGVRLGQQCIQLLENDLQGILL